MKKGRMNFIYQNQVQYQLQKSQELNAIITIYAIETATSRDQRTMNILSATWLSQNAGHRIQRQVTGRFISGKA